MVFGRPRRVGTCIRAPTVQPLEKQMSMREDVLPPRRSRAGRQLAWIVRTRSCATFDIDVNARCSTGRQTVTVQSNHPPTHLCVHSTKRAHHLGPRGPRHGHRDDALSSSTNSSPKGKYSLAAKGRERYTSSNSFSPRVSPGTSSSTCTILRMASPDAASVKFRRAQGRFTIHARDATIHARAQHGSVRAPSHTGSE